jgi:amino acid transporter
MHHHRELVYPLSRCVCNAAERGELLLGCQVEPHNTHWGTFVTILLWSTAGFDLVGACAGEVQNPGETFPAAMTFAMGLTLVIDILSVVVGMSLVRDYASWHDGTFMDVAAQVRAVSCVHAPCAAR